MKQKKKQRKRKHTQATQPARYKNAVVFSPQHHITFSSSKKTAKVSELNDKLKHYERFKIA